MQFVEQFSQVYYAEYFIPGDMSANTTGDSSKRASPEREIQVSAAIGRSLMVSS